MSIPKVIIKHFSLSNCVYVLVLLFPECYCRKVCLCAKLCRPQILDIIFVARECVTVLYNVRELSIDFANMCKHICSSCDNAHFDTT